VNTVDRYPSVPEFITTPWTAEMKSVLDEYTPRLVIGGIYNYYFRIQHYGASISLVNNAPFDQTFDSQELEHNYRIAHNIELPLAAYFGKDTFSSMQRVWLAKVDPDNGFIQPASDKIWGMTNLSHNPAESFAVYSFIPQALFNVIISFAQEIETAAG